MGSRTTDYRKRKTEVELTDSSDSSDDSSYTASERANTKDTPQGGSTNQGKSTHRQVRHSSSLSHASSSGDAVADDNIEQIRPVGGREGGNGSSQDMDTGDDSKISNPSDDGRSSDRIQSSTSSMQGDSDQESDSDAETSEDADFVPDPGDTPIFAGCPISVIQSLLAILTFTCVHNLSGNCLSDLLALISMHLPSVPDVFKSLYRFRKYFASLKTPLQYHYYCSKCGSELTAANTSVCQECPVGTKKQFFITMSLVDQVKNLYRRPGFTSLLKRRFERKKQLDSNYEDVYDGRIYQLYVRKGFLGENNISFVWNSDGVLWRSRHNGG